MDLDTLNQLDQKAFTTALGEIFEHSPWIPYSTWERKPFGSIANLHASLCETLEVADESRKLELIRAHPDLAGKLAISGELTDFSTAEQQSAQLDKLTPEQFEKITTLNESYKTRFKFPFIICVKDHSQSSIFQNFEERVENDNASELQAALKQICRIAWYRLNDLLS